MSFHTVLFNKEHGCRGTERYCLPGIQHSFSCPTFLTTAPRGCGSPRPLSSFSDNHAASLPQLCLHQSEVLGTCLAFGVGLASVSCYTTLGKMLKLPEKHQVFSWANSSRQNSYSAKLFWVHIKICKSSGTTSEPLQCHSIRRLFQP